MPPTRMRSLRVEDEIWDAAQQRAEREHRTLSDVVRVALRAYAGGRYDAKEPPQRKKRE